MNDETPRTDAQTHDTGDECFPGMTPHGDWVPADFARQLERELVEAKAKAGELLVVEDQLKRELTALRAYHDRTLEDDSIVASCGCQTKTNESQYHKTGCKYRLICERDDARRELAEAKDEILALCSDVSAPCGHPSQYCYSPDGVGKIIKCYVCELATSQAREVQLRKAFKGCPHGCTDGNCPHDRMYRQAIFLPPPPVIPLADVKALVETLKTIAKEREFVADHGSGEMPTHAANIAKRALESTKSKHPELI